MTELKTVSNDRIKKLSALTESTFATVSNNMNNYHTDMCIIDSKDMMNNCQ